MHSNLVLARWWGSLRHEFSITNCSRPPLPPVELIVNRVDIQLPITPTRFVSFDSNGQLVLEKTAICQPPPTTCTVRPVTAEFRPGNETTWWSKMSDWAWVPGRQFTSKGCMVSETSCRMSGWTSSEVKPVFHSLCIFVFVHWLLSWDHGNGESEWTTLLQGLTVANNVLQHRVHQHARPVSASWTRETRNLSMWFSLRSSHSRLTDHLHLSCLHDHGRATLSSTDWQRFVVRVHSRLMWLPGRQRRRNECLQTLCWDTNTEKTGFGSATLYYMVSESVR